MSRDMSPEYRDTIDRLIEWVDYYPSYISADKSPKASLEDFREFVRTFPNDKGIRFHGNAGLTSHLAEICCIRRIPTIFCRDDGDFLVCPVMPTIFGDSDNRNFAQASKRANLRFFVRAANIQRDAGGNIRKAHIDFIDRNGLQVGWMPWRVNERMCLNGFRVELKDTKRAGLHIRVGVVVEDSPRDEFGYRMLDPRFISIVRIEGEGVTVIAPHDPIDASYYLGTGFHPKDEDEYDILLRSLVHFYGAQPDLAPTLISGAGSRITGKRPYYAISQAA